MLLLDACEKEITQSREMFVQFGDRSRCFLYMVISKSTSQAVNIWRPFGVRSRPQGCSHQCFHLQHYTVQNTDICGNWVLLQPVSGTEGRWKPDCNSGARLGSPVFTTRACHRWYPGWAMASTVPDTEPGSGMERDAQLSSTSFCMTLPSPRGPGPLGANTSADWLCLGGLAVATCFWRLSPSVTAQGCCGCSLGGGRRCMIRLSTCKVACQPWQATGGLC